MNKTIEILFNDLVFEFSDSNENYNVVYKLISQYHISDSIWKNKITKGIKKALKLDCKKTALRELKILLNKCLEKNFETKAISAFPYPGGKNKMKKELNYALEVLNEDKTEIGEKFEIYADIFFGAGGSLISMSDKLSEIGIKKVIVNELNKTIINIHKLIKEKPNQLINAFSNLIKTKVVSKFGRIFLEKEEYEILASELKEEVHNLEKNNERGVETAIRFILLQCIQYSSNYTPKVTFEVSNFSNKIYSSEKIVEVISSFSNRIKKIHSIYNKFDIEFKCEDAWEVLQQYKKNKNILFNIDIIYVVEDNTPIENFSSNYFEELQSKDIPLARTNYGVKKFDSIKYIKELKYINCIYNNNAHPAIEYYRRKFGLEKLIFTRVETSSSIEKGAYRHTANEYIVFGLKNN
ncbi:hypothetical protein ACMC56_04310 [Campylobacterota bacterium DY0563]